LARYGEGRKDSNLVSAFRIWALKGFISYCVNVKNGKPIKARSAENYLVCSKKTAHYRYGYRFEANNESQELKNVRKGAKNEEIGQLLRSKQFQLL